MTRRSFITAGLTALLTALFAPYSLVRALCGWKQGGKVTTAQDAKETSDGIPLGWPAGTPMVYGADGTLWLYQEGAWMDFRVAHISDNIVEGQRHIVVKHRPGAGDKRLILALPI